MLVRRGRDLPGVEPLFPITLEIYRRDGWQGYGLVGSEDTGELLTVSPQRWLLGTHQGSVEPAHLARNLDEFVFRFNRRRSRSRGMVFYRVLELAAAHEPLRYQDLIATRASGPAEPSHRHSRWPWELWKTPANRPWRTAGPFWVRLNGYPRPSL